MMRVPYIAGNWKMHKTVEEAVALAKTIASQAQGDGKKIMVAPPFTALKSVSEEIKGSRLLLGAQNMGPEVEGAHTGEVSVLMLKEVGVSVVIIGHSERRHVYGEQDQLINRKVRLALRQGLEVIFCVGEQLEQRERGITERVVEEQVKKGLEGVRLDELARVTIAYEPVWAIGTGKTATPEDADETHRFIRDLISRLYNREASEAMVIQYGGSVKPHNAADLMRKKNIDGLLVGGASLKAEDFIQIINYEQG